MKKLVVYVGIATLLVALFALVVSFVVATPAQQTVVSQSAPTYQAAPVAPVVVRQNSFWEDMFFYHMLFGGDSYYYHPFGYGGFISHPYGFYRGYHYSRPSVTINKTTVINKASSATVSKPTSRWSSFFKSSSSTSSAASTASKSGSIFKPGATSTGGTKTYSTYKPSTSSYSSFSSRSYGSSSSFSRSYSSSSSSFGRSSFGRR